MRIIVRVITIFVRFVGYDYGMEMMAMEIIVMMVVMVRIYVVIIDNT